MTLFSRMYRSRVVAVAFLFGLALTVYIYKEEAKHIIAAILESGSILVFIWTYIIVAFISKNLFLGRVRSNYFETTTEAIFAISGYGVAASTSVTLLKGSYLQFFYQAQFFYNFNELDIASIFLVSTYLLIYIGIVTTKMLADVLIRAKGSSAELTESVQVVDSSEVNNNRQDVISHAEKPNKLYPQMQNISITTAQAYKCSHCGFGYHLINPLGPNAGNVGATTTCPKCGNVEIVK